MSNQSWTLILFFCFLLSLCLISVCVSRCCYRKFQINWFFGDYILLWLWLLQYPPIIGFKSRVDSAARLFYILPFPLRGRAARDTPVNGFRYPVFRPRAPLFYRRYGWRPPPKPSIVEFRPRAVASTGIPRKKVSVYPFSIPVPWLKEFVILDKSQVLTVFEEALRRLNRLLLDSASRRLRANGYQVYSFRKPRFQPPYPNYQGYPLHGNRLGSPRLNKLSMNFTLGRVLHRDTP